MALGISGCSSQDTYHYNGKIGEEQISFYEENLGNQNILKVTRTNGITVTYFDMDDDLKLDYIDITKDEETTRYFGNVIGKEIIEEGQRQFDKYLKEILRLKQEKGLKDISKE